MSLRPRHEAKLISALVTVGEVDLAPAYGITPEMFAGYQAEYRWLLSYQKMYGHAPSVDALETKFPAFPYAETHEVHFHADEVRFRYNEREIARVIRDAAEAVAQGDPEEAAFHLQSLNLSTAATAPLRDTLSDDSFLADWGAEVPTIRTPWKSLEKATGGLEPGSLWYVAARLGQGKSWTLGCLIRDAVLEGKRVVLASLEMPEAQVRMRMHVLLARELGIDVTHHELKKRTYDPILYRRLLGAIKERVPGKLYVIDTSKGAISPATVSAHARDTDAAFVDYAGLLANPMGGRAVDDWRSMAAISNMLKEVAQQRNIPVVAAAQINREGDGAGWRPPKVKNLAQSDALGQDADVVITHKRLSKSTMTYSVEKNRDGEGGLYFWTRFQPNDGRFEEITREQAETIADGESDD